MLILFFGCAEHGEHSALTPTVDPSLAWISADYTC